MQSSSSDGQENLVALFSNDVSTRGNAEQWAKF
jgi:hypothetical protein